MFWVFPLKNVLWVKLLWTKHLGHNSRPACTPSKNLWFALSTTKSHLGSHRTWNRTRWYTGTRWSAPIILTALTFLICLLHSYLKKKGVRCPLPLPPWEPRSLGDVRWPFICRTKSHCSLDSSSPRIHAGYVKQCSVTQTLNFNSPSFALLCLGYIH